MRTARTARAAESSAKLALLERLLGVMDVAECIDGALAWLTAHTGATQAICALANQDTGLLTGVAGRQVAPPQVEAIAVALDDTTHPLVRAMQLPQPTLLEAAPRSAGGDTLSAPVFGRSRYWALPLGTLGAGQPAGGLLLVVLNGTPTADVVWLADVLSQKLHTLLTRDALAEGQGKLRRERSLLDAVINAVADPILLTDTDGRLLIANGRAEALFSTSPVESEGRRRAVELNNMFLSAALWRVAVGSPGQVTPQELLVVDPVDGSDLLFELLGTVVHDPREGTGIVSVLRNVTDLRRATEELSENYRRIRMAEAEVRSERDRLDLIIDSVADPILVSDDAGKVTLMNVPAERLFTGVADGDEAAQRHLRANDAHFSSFISGLLSDGTEIRRRGEVALSDVATGAPLPYEAIAGKVLSEAGELIAVVTILHDRSEALERARLYEQVKEASNELEAKVVAATTELARQNKLLRHQAVELEQASALKSQFLANMSHEFRTPLNAILGYASILLQGISGELNPAQKKALDRIASNGRHLVGIISEILDLSRIEAGRMPLQISTFTPKQLVEEVLAEMEPIIARSKLTVSSEVSSDLGPILSDRQKVKQVVLNLLSNALKFTREGSVTIRAAYAATPSMVTIAITDTGIGIDPSDHEKIFEDFQQVDSSVARPYGGTGLGLSICRRLATMLGGRLDMQSEVGRGSTFTLVIASRLRK